MLFDSFAWNRRKLRAALWILKIIGQEGCSVHTLRSSWAILPVAGQVDIDEFEATFLALAQGGFILQSGDHLMPDIGLQAIASNSGADLEELLYSEIISRAHPLWLRTSTNDGYAAFVSSELVPDDVARGLESIIPDPVRREAFLLTRARKVRTDEMLALGEAAEVAAFEALFAELVRCGEQALASMVCRVSLISDELGYDITAPRLDGSPRRIEVKGVKRYGAVVSVVVTANEMTIGCSDPDWYLLVVEVREYPTVIGWVDARTLEPLLPTNPGEGGRWLSARLKFPVKALVEGLPPVVGSNR